MTATCDSVRPTTDGGEGIVSCDLPANHVKPTEKMPQGTPHEDKDHPDTLTGEPTRWW